MTDEPTSHVPPPSREEPRVLGGRYEVGPLVGRGGMADVHQGHDLRLGRTVAIKILRTDLARDSSFLSRFRREAQSAAGLSHPSIVGVFDSGEQTVHEAGGAPVQVPYIVMEFLQGKTLRELLNESTTKTLEPDEAARVTAAVLSALEYAHDRGLVHRDIKPANVMVTESGAVKVMDFGIARALADTAATMTQTSAVMGTARYLSPEQAQGMDVDGRSDLYSVGCLLYELLTGRTPFQGDPVSLVYQHLGEVPKLPSTHARHLPEALDAITLHALEKQPEDRYQSAAEFRADLNAARADEPISDRAGRSLAMVTSSAAAGVGTGAGAGATAAARAASERGDQPRPYADSADDSGLVPGLGSGRGGDRSSREDDRWERTDEMPVRERRHPGAALLLGVLALLAVAGVGWVLWQVLGPDAQEEVPLVPVTSTISMTEAAARTTLMADGFVVPEASSRNSSAEIGTVIEQDPNGGTAREGSTVRLVVSAGPEAQEIPLLVGMEEQAARDELARRGFTNVRAEAEESDNTAVEKGHVIGTDPAAGEEIKPDDEIILEVSSGKVEVPDLIGKDRDEAITLLSDARLRWRPETRVTTEEEADTVLEQSVDAGDRVDVGTRITIVIAEAPPETVWMPPETITIEPAPPPTTAPPEQPTDDPTEPTDEPTTDTPTTDPADPTDTPAPTDDPPTDTPSPTDPGTDPPADD
ncbi:Stk1 family PASTA domain-containing Ser/Thr kinase [Ornithinimicrobium sp. Y1694]|uniref:Stk1 family PASTA domain-containing Ser/Thr kinase n=1 Tax=Ornithinimicrobium sp. Y1694 TaxID=3418590 RepID=UPI003CFA2E8C